MRLSIVATLYQSVKYIDEFHQRASAAARKLCDDDYEIILVNDGSPDDSVERAIQLADIDTHVIVVDLSRNFGHHKAMMTGLSYATGEEVFLIDSDLEEEPEWLLPFADQAKRERCDVVYGVQRKRKGGVFENWSGVWFYRFFRLITGVQLPENVVTARFMSRRYVEALLMHQEREVFLAGLWQITGFDQKPQYVHKHSSSQTTYSLRRKLSLLVNSVTSFSNAPLILIFYLGLIILIFASAYTSHIIILWLFFAKPLVGWTSLIASIWMIGGMVISFIGIVGIYLSKIFSETKQRPYTIVRHVYRKRNSGSAQESR